jgi:hypothetical protein
MNRLQRAAPSPTYRTQKARWRPTSSSKLSTGSHTPLYRELSPPRLSIPTSVPKVSLPLALLLVQWVLSTRFAPQSPMATLPTVTSTSLSAGILLRASFGIFSGGCPFLQRLGYCGGMLTCLRSQRGVSGTYSGGA